MDYINETKKKLEDELQKTMSRVLKLRSAIDILEELDGTKDHTADPSAPGNAKQDTPGRDALQRSDELCASDRSGVRRTRKKKSASRMKVSTKAKPPEPIKAGKSQYKGVKPAALAGGGFKYHASYWDGKKKKAKYLGAFDDELTAAAKVQEALGDKTEARRLYDLAEQIENSPERGEKGKGKKEKVKNTETFYRCKGCKMEYKTKPVSCPNCNRSSFVGPLARSLSD